MDNNRLEEIKNRKKERDKKRRIMLIALCVAVIIVILLIIFAVKSVVSFIASCIPTPTPTPVPILSDYSITEMSDVESTEATEETATTNSTTATVPQAASVTADIPAVLDNNDMLNIIEGANPDLKVCYLTFDDGPNKTVTLQILDILRRFNVKATFFEVGSLIEENKDIAKRVAEEGHLIGNHSFDHTYSKIYADSESFMNEVNECAELIKDAMGDRYFPIIRFPGGSYNSGSYGEQKQEFKKVLAENGYYHCDWNALSGDAEGGTKTALQLIERAKSSASGKSQVVVLMHDAPNKKNTVEALPEIIKYFISEGYTFSTLDKPLK